MTVIVQDWRGFEVEVGGTAIYGAPNPDEVEDSIVEVIKITDPDVVYNPDTDADDGGYEVVVTVRFKDGVIDEIRSPYCNGMRHAQWEVGEEIDEVFETADLDVISQPVRHVKEEVRGG